ncbi:MAG: hypothetical protein R3274_03940 [Desulfobacterales bacterium]|nr:hypothetical protein [Desulfobacterales bacterium]
MPSSAVRFVTICFAIGSFLSGCSATDPEKTATPDLYPARTAKRMVTDIQGTPFLIINCEYVGRQPYKGYPSDVPWQTRATEFYNIGFQNLTPHKITFISKKVYQKDSPRNRTETGDIRLVLTDSADFTRRPDADFNVLEPFEERKLINWAFRANPQPSEHIATIVLQIQYQGDNYTFNIPLVNTRP